MSTQPELLERLADSQKACFDKGLHIAAMDIQSAREFIAREVTRPAQPVSRSLPAIPDDDADFTPDLARKIIAKYQQMLSAAQCTPQPSWEPVAWQAREKAKGPDWFWDHCDIPHLNPDYEYRPLYAHSAVSCAAREAPLVDAVKMARTRLEWFADAAHAGHIHYSARELKRKIWAAFADVDTVLAALPAAGGEASKREGDLRAALTFYADPFAWKALHDPEDTVRVPDFYSETSFGDTASEALAVVPEERNTTTSGGK